MIPSGRLLTQLSAPRMWKDTVDLRTYAQVLKRRWRAIPACILICLGAAVALTALTPKTFQSTAQFFVSAADTSTTAELAQGGVFTQARVKSYTQLITTPKVLGPVAQRANVKGGFSTVEPMVKATVAPDTVIINTSVTSTSPSQARAVATALADTFPKTVDELERTGSRESPVKVTVVQQPSKATLAGPSWPTNVALGLLLGTLAGIALALLVDRFDTRIRTKHDVDDLADVAPVLGSIPFDKDAPKHPIALATSAYSGRSEAIRSLRTNLQFIDAANHPRVIVLTSSVAGEGKTTTTANLAYALADAGASVCLVEADLRRPRLLRYLGMEGGVGLTDVLIGRAELKDVAQRVGSLRLMAIGAGATPPNPSELLGSQGMKDVLAELRGRFDYVIVDAPPLLPVTDSAVLSALTDGAVLVVGSGIAKQDQLDAALDSLEQAGGKALGLVLNRVPRKGSGNYYDYSYEYRESKVSDSASSSVRAGDDAPSRRSRR